MRRVLISLLILSLSVILLITPNALALSYEDKPSVTAFISGSNHLTRGDYKTIYVTIYNPAERKKVDYIDKEEAAFFSKNEDMLFTAYNVRIELIGNEFIQIKTPAQNISVLPPLQPINLPFVVKVSDDAKKGEYELKMKVEFDRIDDLVYLDTYSPELVPVQKTVVGSNETVTYEYQILTESYKIRYKHETMEIPLKIFVEEKDVELEIVNVSSDNLMGKSKGKIVLEVRNVGEKTARSAYLVLETPSGFETASVQQPTLTSMNMIPSASIPTTSMQTALQSPSMPSSTSIASTQAPSYYVGDLKPNDVAKAIFYIKINTKDEGNYTFKVKAVYLDEFGKVRVSDPIPFGVYIEKAPDFEVSSVESKVFVNAKGDVVVKIIPDKDLKDVSLYLSTNQPLSVLSTEYYLGDVEAGKEYTAVFKVKASDEAKPVTYPAEIKMKYRTMDEYFYSDAKSIGIKVNPKMRFEVYGIPKIHAGSTEVVTFIVKNTGNFTIREATARLTITDPFSSSDDTAYIGTLEPGESAEVKFKLSVDVDATPKKYGLNLEVKYKDLEDEWAISEPTKAVIEVLPPKPPYGAIAFVVIIAIIAVAYYLRRRGR